MPDGHCYRQEVGQICANGSTHVFQAFEERGLTLGRFGLREIHVRRQAVACEDMATESICVDHVINKTMDRVTRGRKELYNPDRSDQRFVQHTELNQEAVPILDVSMSAARDVNIASVYGIFLVGSPGDADDCARALGLIPPWMTLASLPAPVGVLSERVEKLLDRNSIYECATASLDRIWSFEVGEEGHNAQVGCHTPTNLRLTDSARNNTRRNSFSAGQWAHPRASHPRQVAISTCSWRCQSRCSSTGAASPSVRCRP